LYKEERRAVVCGVTSQSGTEGRMVDSHACKVGRGMAGVELIGVFSFKKCFF